jgi:hypothetical protein
MQRKNMVFTPVKAIQNNKKTSDLFSWGEGDRTITIGNLVKEYLLAAQLRYGNSIDAYEVLAQFGIKENDELLGDGRKYLRYINLAEKVADELVSHLTMFGFKADKKKKPKVEGFENAKHINGNMVYTNYPWIVTYKAGRAAIESYTAMIGKHDEGIDLSLWEELKPNQVRKWKVLQETKVRFAREEIEPWMNQSFTPLYDELTQEIEEDVEEMMTIARTRQPSRYGVYDV